MRKNGALRIDHPKNANISTSLAQGTTTNAKAITARGKYKQLFGCNKLKLIILDTLREVPADYEAVARRIIERKGWRMDDALWVDILKRTRDAIQRAQKAGYLAQDFGPSGCL